MYRPLPRPALKIVAFHYLYVILAIVGVVSSRIVSFKKLIRGYPTFLLLGLKQNPCSSLNGLVLSKALSKPFSKPSITVSINPIVLHWPFPNCAR